MNLGDLASGNGGRDVMNMLMRRRDNGAGITAAGPAQFGQMPENGYPQKGPNDLPRHVMPPGVERPPFQFPPNYPLPTPGQGGMAEAGIDGQWGGAPELGGAQPMPLGGDDGSSGMRQAQPGGPGGMRERWGGGRGGSMGGDGQQQQFMQMLMRLLGGQ